MLMGSPTQAVQAPWVIGSKLQCVLTAAYVSSLSASVETSVP